MVAHFTVPCQCRAAASGATATAAVNQRQRQANISIESNSIQRLAGETEASNGASSAMAAVSYGESNGIAPGDSSSSGQAQQPSTVASNTSTTTTTATTVMTVQKELKRVFLSNRTVTCNDGSQAGFYLRKSPGSRRWVVFFEGGWHCYDHKSCRARWLKLRHLMTSAQWPETRDGKSFGSIY